VVHGLKGVDLVDPNENRVGYKKTKIGWIPEEWDIRRLAILVSIQSGNSPSIYHPKTDGKYPFVKVDDMNLCFREQNEAREYTNLQRAIIPKGSILFAKRGAAIVTNKIRISGVPLVIDSNMMALIPNIKKILTDFLYYFIQNEKLYRISDTSAIPQINNKHINPYIIPLPPLPEQKKIAEILSTWDKAIDQNRKLINAKIRMKKALMQQLLTGKKRLSGFSQVTNRKANKFFDIPADWNCPRIRDIAEEISERNNNRDNLTVMTCSKHKGFVESTEYFGKQVFSEDTSNYKIIQHNYFSFPANHVEEGSIGLLSSHDIGIVSPIYTVFKFNERVLPEYMYAVFKSETFRHIFAMSTNASVNRRGSLRWKEFSLIRVPLPTLEEQQRINDIIKILEKEIKGHEVKLKALEKQKRGLMQKLLTGEIRVKV